MEDVHPVCVYAWDIITLRYCGYTIGEKRHSPSRKSNEITVSDDSLSCFVIRASSVRVPNCVSGKRDNETVFGRVETAPFGISYLSVLALHL